MIPKFMQEFGMMVCDIILILECYEGALKRMLITFEEMVLLMKRETYTALVKSEEYRNVHSVRALFQLLGPYWKPVDCSLLEMLQCVRRRLLGSKKTSVTRMRQGKLWFWVEEGENIHVPLSVATGKNHPVTSKVQELLPKKSPPSSNSTTAMLSSNVFNHSPLHNAGSATPHHPDPTGQPPTSDMILSQPKVQKDSLLISAKTAQNKVTWAEYDCKASLLCGLLRLPHFMLQYEGVEPGCVMIKWITSECLLPYILSNIMDDGDLQLLLQENVVSIQIGTEYTITVGSPKYWKVSISIHNMCTYSYSVYSVYNVSVQVRHLVLDQLNAVRKKYK